MATDQKFTRLYNKKIAPIEAWKDKFLDYLRGAVESTAAAFMPLDGTIGTTKVPVVAGGTNRISIGASGGPYIGINGNGRIFNIANADSRLQTVYVPPTAVIYTVALESALIEDDVEVNVRTGEIEYKEYKEEIGRVGTPTSVTDNGDGTLTFNVNSLFESGDSSVGRRVKVWLKPKQDGGLVGPQSSDAAVAFETCTVTYSAPNNRITSVAKFGQANASTTASDYKVMSVGPTIRKKTTEDLRNTSGAWFIADVTGVTAGGTIVTISTTDQNLYNTSSWLTVLATYASTTYVDAGDAVLSSEIDDALEVVEDRALGIDNLLMNGGMRWWQGVPDIDHPDRWRVENVCHEVFEGVQPAFTESVYRTAAGLDGFLYCYRMDFAEGVGETFEADVASVRLKQEIDREFVRAVKGKKLAVSFWVRRNSTALPAGTTLSVVLEEGTGDPIDGVGYDGRASSFGYPYTGSNIVHTSNFTVPSADTWTKIVVPITTNAVAQALLQFRIQFNFLDGAVGTAARYDFTGFTLVPTEYGVSNPVFRPAGGTYESDFKLCQKYFEKSYARDTNLFTVTGEGMHMQYIPSMAITLGSDIPIYQPQYKVEKARPVAYSRPVSPLTGAMLKLADGGGTDRDCVTANETKMGLVIHTNVATYTPSAGFIRVHWYVDCEWQY